MTTGSAETSERELRTRAPTVLAFLLLASALAMLAATVALAGTRCAAQNGPADALSLPELALAAGSALAFALWGAVIVLHRPRNRVGWLSGVIGLTFSFAQFADAYITCAVNGPAGPNVLPFIAWLAYLAFPLTIALMFSLLPFIFPDGRFVSPAWRRLAFITQSAMALSVLLTVLLQGPLVYSGVDVNYRVDNPFGLLPPSFGPALADVALLTAVAACLSGIASLVVRLRLSQGDMRQQLKFLFYFVAVALAALLAVELYGDMINEAVFDSIIYLLILALTFWGFPVVIGLAVFKYRLYEIDIVIRKTLVYTVVTAMLALAYFGSVAILQGLSRSLTGAAQSPLVVVMSTLLIAALFSPLRRRVQDFVDRRFFRRKYDARLVLAQFGAVARRETDLDALSAAQVRVIEQTLQPKSVGVWLQETGRSGGE